MVMIEEGWLLNSESGISLLNYLSREETKRASQFKSTNSTLAAPSTLELVSARLEQNARQPSCVMGILSRLNSNDRSSSSSSSSSSQKGSIRAFGQSSASIGSVHSMHGPKTTTSTTGAGSFWNSVKHNYHWTVRLHGDSGTGKSVLSLALCRLQADNFFSGPVMTPGMVIRECLVPLKFVNESRIHWARLEIEDVGSLMQSQFNYLKYDCYKRIFHVHIVVLSMTDLQSLESAKETIRYLVNECGVESTKILAVATKVDEFQSYQVTDSDLQDFSSEMQVPLCLVDNYVQFGEQYSAYTVVEELSRLLLNQ